MDFEPARGDKSTEGLRSRSPARASAKLLLWCLIFFLELIVCLTAFVVVRMFIVRKYVVAKQGDVTVQGPGVQPQLFFACCEADLAQIQSILANRAQVAHLQNLHAGLAVALTDLTAPRAQVVRQLNDAGIPAVAWILLPGNQGYYVNAANAPESAARFDQFQQWTKTYGLKWAALGLDIEPDAHDFNELTGGRKARLFGKLIWRYFDVTSPRRAQTSYAALIAKIQSQGYTVQTYQMPFIVNGRKANSTLFERLTGIVNVRSNLEVLMLYTSAARTIGPAMIWRFGPDAQSIAVGSTESDPTHPALNWDEFSRDLIVASHFTPVVGVYDLEGSARQGFLSRLETMNWSQSVVITAQQMQQISLLSEGIQTVSWAMSHLPYFALIIIAADALIIIWRRRPARAAS